MVFGLQYFVFEKGHAGGPVHLMINLVSPNRVLERIIF